MDVKELLTNKNIKFKSSARDYVINCLNPEHEDSNPSMRIDKLTGVFHCFSCGFSGDIFEYFKIKRTNLVKTKIQFVIEKIYSLLNSGSILTPLDAVPIDYDIRGISGKTLSKFGAFTTESIEKLLDRVVFPVKDVSNNTKFFIGRYIHSDISPKYQFYPEHCELILYPSIPESIQNSIILVEGIFDALRLYDNGLTNAVCTFGTAFGTVKKKIKQQKNIEKLLNFKYQGIDTIYIMFDGDEAGRTAAKGLYEYIPKNTFNVEIIELEDGTDPGSLSGDMIQEIKESLYG